MTLDCELTSRRKTLLYLYQVCPVIDVVDMIYNMKRSIEYNEIVKWYIDQYPFKDKTNETYMKWFIREFNVFSKLSYKGIEQIQGNHRSIFEKLTSIYINDVSYKKIHTENTIS